MNQLQKDCKLFRETILSILWRQWTALGVAGQKKESVLSVIDPEALLNCSLSLCRFDPRLFDEIIDWLVINGEYINVQRLTALHNKYHFDSGPQLSAVSTLLLQNTEYTLKWQKLSLLNRHDDPQYLFFTIDGKQIPVSKDPDVNFLSKGLIRNKVILRKYSSLFPIEGSASLILRLRAFMGVSARVELLCILAEGIEIHSAEAARITGYNRKTIQNALNDMARSGIVHSRITEREKYYRLHSGILNGLLPEKTKWINWTPLYKAIEILYHTCGENENDSLILSSIFRKNAAEAQKYFEEASTGILLTDPSRFPGEKYSAVFQKDIGRMRKEFDLIT